MKLPVGAPLDIPYGRTGKPGDHSIVNQTERNFLSPGNARLCNWKIPKYGDVKILRGISLVFKYAFLIALVLPAGASAADYIVHRHDGGLLCHYEESGQRYCVQSPPVAKVMYECDRGGKCRHIRISEN